MLKIKTIYTIPIVFIFSIFTIGMFHEYLSCLFSVIILIWLMYKVSKDKEIRLKINLTTISVFVIVASYLLSFFWALDSGMAFIGFLKYLPIVLFLIVLLQEKEIATIVRGMLPSASSAMTAISFLGMNIPYTSELFSVSGRLAGFFQYPNTFALFLLVSVLVLLEKETLKVTDYIVSVIIFIGIILSGSRSIFVVAILCLLIQLPLKKNKSIKAVILKGGIFLVIVSGLIMLFGDKVDVIERFMNISIQESTFIGRCLYVWDALPVVLKHPFGLGYMGYHYIQRSIQTGVYSVMYIHNDWIQMMLDIGWIPALLFLATVIKALISKSLSNYMKLIVGVMFFHGCFDFDWQFIAIFCMMFLFLDYDVGKELQIKMKVPPFCIGSIMLILICACCGISLYMTHWGKYENAYQLYQWNTQNNIELMAQETDVEKANQMADQILEQNKYVAIAYSMKAGYAYTKGDFGKVIAYQRQVLDLAPFQYEEYERYCYMLMNGISLYIQNGDSDSAEICRDELREVTELILAQEDRLSVLGKKIKDKPQIEYTEELGRELLKYLK